MEKPTTKSHNQEVIVQFSQQAAGYSRLTGSLKSDRSAALRALVSASPDDLVLDVCCGPGVLTLDLAPHVLQATGIDLTPAMLDQARAAQAERGVTNVTWMTGDVTALPFDDGAFSLVLCSAAFHHLECPRDVLGEMARVCRPGGRIVVRDVTPAPEKAEAYDRMEKLRDPSHSHALTVDEIRALGIGLPVGEAQITLTVTADLPLAAILATSFPDACSNDDIYALFREDALSGEDKFGFSARMIDGKVHVSYPMCTAMWSRH